MFKSKRNEAAQTETPNNPEIAEQANPAPEEIELDGHIIDIEEPPAIAQPMETEVTTIKSPLTELEAYKELLKARRNLDVGFETTNFDVANAIDMVLELDKYTKISVFNSWKVFLNMQCINQAIRFMPDVDKTAEGRDEYDQTIAKLMDEYETEGDFTFKLPAFIALNEKLRQVMYDDMLEPSELEDTLKFMTRNVPTAQSFEKDYERRLKEGHRPGITKREFCESQLSDALKKHHKLEERGQAAIEFCNDLKVQASRGFGDLPDWAINTLYNKLTEKLTQRRAKLDIKRTSGSPNESSEAQADQMLLEFVFEHITGRGFISPLYEQPKEGETSTRLSSIGQQ